ncbi:MAG: glutathione S-transferase N-terminal domain-containing protein [Alphaproteobacteria bacterium]|nr:glutathione S-transferase N-terminal domain-containing protein [Alphaproteobacteria bacterium]
MKILGSPGSPYVRKIRIVALEKRIPFEFQRIDLLDPNSELSGANPLGKIPALIRDNGKALYDSSVIAEYLDALAPGPRLIPEVLEDRAEVKRWEAVADGIMDATVAISHDYILSDVDGGGLAWSNANQQRKIDLGLALMERELGAEEFCYGGRLGLADIACVVALAYLDHVLPKAEWRKAHPGLRGLFDRMEARDSFKATRH